MSDTPGRTDRILAGINTQNDPAEFEGRQGFWVQADAVFIEAKEPAWAIVEYRKQFEQNSIGCSHNHFCGSILHAKANKEVQSLERQLAEVRAVMHQLARAVEESPHVSACQESFLDKGYACRCAHKLNPLAAYAALTGGKEER